MVCVDIIIYDIFYLLNLFIHFTLKLYALIYRSTKKNGINWFTQYNLLLIEFYTMSQGLL